VRGEEGGETTQDFFFSTNENGMTVPHREGNELSRKRRRRKNSIQARGLNQLLLDEKGENEMNGGKKGF